MKQVDSKIYTKDYYLNVCLGHEEYQKTKGKVLSKKWEEILEKLPLKKGMSVLDLGCGRGDVCFYLAKKGINVIGIDYSKDAIKLANDVLNLSTQNVRKRIKFYNQNAKDIDFRKDSFDIVIAFDFFEHLYKEGLEQVMKKVSEILRRKGLLVIHTEANKLYLDYTHRSYTYPLSSFFIFINNKLFNKSYPGLPKDPRNEYHKQQHVNEPTIFYLRDLFSRYSFNGKIIQNMGLLKPVFKWKDRVYNFIVCLHPLSLFFPLNIFFTTDYTCIMKNNKKV